MNRRKLVEWAGLDTFLVCGNDLRLYRVGTGPMRFTPEAPPQPGQPTLIATAPDLQFPKCLAWLSPHAAAGLLNGKVVLTRFDGQGPPRAVKEFVPRHSRSCNALAWNPSQPTQLAAGLDKVRNDFSALVWDVEARGEARAAAETQQTVETVTRASTELANSEATVALTWVPGRPSCLATGTGVKWLRIYDLRGDLNTPPSVVAHSKAVLGVLFDPFAEQRFATFSDSTDGVVKLWDLRMLTDPVFALNTGSKALHQVEWSPTRPGVLATLSKDELGLKLWDLKESDKTATLALNAPPRVHPSTEALSCIAWHPRLEQAVLSVSNSGVVELSTLHVPLAISWAPRATLASTYGKVVSIQSVATPGEQDVSEAMRQRLAQGYSIDVTVNRTLGKQRLLPLPLRRVWSWMHRVSRLFADPQPPVSAPLSPQLQSAAALHKQDRYRGVHVLLSPTTTPAQAESGGAGEVTIAAWRSPARALALQICGGGWGAPTKEALEHRLQLLEQKGEHERAAALAVFHRDLRRAIEALQKGGEARKENSLAMVGYVLAGYNEGPQGALWRGRCRALAAQYDHPYLRAVFAFLTAEARDFRPLLDGALSLRDRIAFAITFLPDSELVTFLDRLTTAVVRAGELEGILLTGLGAKGLELLESYVDATGDVQSACLLAQHAPARKTSPLDERLSRWGEWYRVVLNRWEAWHERARLDIAYYRDLPDVEAKPPPQVFARCNFCLDGDTLVTLETGLSMRIKDLAEQRPMADDYLYPKVLALSEKQTFVPAAMTSFFAQGRRECCELVFSDGRTLVCTPDHQIMTTTGWCRADLLIPNESKVVLGLDGPHYDPTEDRTEHVAAFQLTINGKMMHMRTPRGVAEAHALARLLGSLYTDSTARFDEKDKVFSGRLYLGHAIDAEQAANDIELVSGTRPTISLPTDQADYFKVHFRGTFVRALHEHPNIRIPLGRRVSQAYELPKVVTDENAPASFVREFLRGLFSGDGGVPVPKEKGATTWSTVTFHMSKEEPVKDAIPRFYAQLEKLLARFGIRDMSTQQWRSPNSVWKSKLSLAVKEIVSFQERVGICYCAHKQQRLAVAAAFYRASNYTRAQALALLDTVDRMTVTQHQLPSPMTQGRSNATAPEGIIRNSNNCTTYRRALEELEKSVIINRDAIPDRNTIWSVLNGHRSRENLSLRLGMSPRDFITKMAAVNFFSAMDDDSKKKDEDKNGLAVEESHRRKVRYGVSRDLDGFPRWETTFMGFKSVSVRNVYDIAVERLGNFLANGIMVHNCNQSLSLGMVVPSKVVAALAAKARAGKATGGFAGKQRVTSCPSCNKPLPRCALCLMHLACSIPSPGAQDAAHGTAPFSEWFTWCQTCRHGGHTKHILDWFRTHDVCPVTDCNCRCNTL